MKTRKRWTPKFNERFYAVTWYGGIYQGFFQEDNNPLGLVAYKFGNCFRTKAKAIRARAAIRKALREVK